jgi:hypothetical protein
VPGIEGEEKELYLVDLQRQVLELITLSQDLPRGMSKDAVLDKFPTFFSKTLRAANCTPYDIELVDSVPVRSPPFRCAPPKVAVFCRIVNELLEQVVIKASKSPYASPAFLIPKSGGNFRMVVYYRKVNTKVVFDSYPVPTIDQALEQFGGAVRFLVLDQNSAYY